MRFPRSSGILLHPTSLPSRFGIGDLGAEAHAFVEFLGDTGQLWWQMLPLGPTGAGNSPYQSPSSFAGNPLLVSPDFLVEHGWIKASDIPSDPRFPVDHVDFPRVMTLKNHLLRRASTVFNDEDPGFQEFLTHNAGWLDDYALYMAIREAHGGQPWDRWEPDLLTRRPEAVRRWREKLADEVRHHQIIQYFFDLEWKALRRSAAARNVKLIGDIPIFVSHDSADVWARPDLFFLDERGRSTVVAGVPPDYFSETGQLWGNPLYRWEAHERDGFAWWISRISALLERVDLIRIDHFRGFESYWEVPEGSLTAEHGRWAPGPGAGFFKVLQHHFVGLPLIAEDLGLITPEVGVLRDQFELPGMRILQFGFGADEEAERNLPHRFVPHCLVYTGTHDNDTSIGWLKTTHAQTTLSLEEIDAERKYALRYLGSDGTDFSWDMIRLALSSVADVAITPLQDVLALDSQARMNVPGKAEGNWGWRIRAEQLDSAARNRLAELTALYSRWNGIVPIRLDPKHRPLPIAKAIDAMPTAQTHQAQTHDMPVASVSMVRGLATSQALRREGDERGNPR